MLCAEEEIEVYPSISPLSLYHTHKMHLVFIKLYPSLFGSLADQGLRDALPGIHMPCNDTILAVFVPGIVASQQQNLPLVEQHKIDSHEHPWSALLVYRVVSPCLSGLGMPRQDRRAASACLLQRFPRPLSHEST